MNGISSQYDAENESSDHSAVITSIDTTEEEQCKIDNSKTVMVLLLFTDGCDIRAKSLNCFRKDNKPEQFMIPDSFLNMKRWKKVWVLD